MAQKQNTLPPKGSRDFLPRDVRRREHVLKTVRAVYGRYGFEPLETPAMERLETLLGKYGEEGDQLIFRILERGAELGRAVDKIVGESKTAAEPRALHKFAERELAEMALRYDLTVPLARVVAEYQAELPKFFKRYQIQPVWRADRPAKGRFREFYQCDVDIVGSESLLCEVEVCSAIAEVMDGLGFDDYKIRLNHRGVLRGMIEASGIALTHEVDAITALDKLDKIGVDGVAKEMAERGIAADAASALIARAQLAEKHTGGSLLEELSRALEKSEAGSRGVKQLQELVGHAAHTPAGRRLAVDPSLARGLSYYTGPIFEVAVKDLAGSLGGGGRYDKLVGMFLNRDLPAVGFSLGLERILVVMEERNMFPALDAPAEVMVFRIEDATTAETLQTLHAVRAAGIAAELYPNVDKLGKQFQYATTRGARVAAFVGGQEKTAGTVALKQLQTQQQTSVPRAELVPELKKLLAAR
ncbi:MAG: histidine--tRNA ligase [Deltaproteobacteria bacterium]|nr:histidine--tRNA ligase [Deltaproteobacteria bacterium]